MVGDFEPQGMLDMIEKYIWFPGRREKVEEAPNPPLPELQGGGVHLVHLPGARASADFRWQSSHQRAKHPDWLRLTLANSIYLAAAFSIFAAGDEYPRAEGPTRTVPRSGAHPLRPARVFPPFFSAGRAK